MKIVRPPRGFRNKLQFYLDGDSLMLVYETGSDPPKAYPNPGFRYIYPFDRFGIYLRKIKKQLQQE